MSGEGTQEQFSKRQFDTLLIDANLALASIDSEETPESEASRQQKLEKAHKTYKSIRDRLPTVPLSHLQQISLNKKLTLLKFRLS
jgi:hypothetical protein